MKRTATILGIAGALAVPSVAVAGNVSAQAERPQVVRSAVVESALVESALVESALVRSAVVESALVRPALVESAVVLQRAQAHKFKSLIRALVR